MQNYQQSLLLSPENNIRINKINTSLESILAVSVFISSILILTIEKNWWGGYLSWSNDNEKEGMAYSDMMLSVYHMRSRFEKTDVY